MKYRTSELGGQLLDAAVAKAEGHYFHIYSEAESPLGRPLTTAWKEHYDNSSEEEFEPSVDWAAAGPIIEREHISVMSPRGDRFNWLAECAKGKPEYGFAHGETPLISAMRAYVASKFGEQIDLP